MAAEMPPSRSRALLRELGSDPVETLFRSDFLTDIEKKRARAAMPVVASSGFVSAEAYPEQLLQSEAYPPVLGVSGDFTCLSHPCIAVVGTRNASTYGKACAQKFAEALGRAGVTIISGGALGIDASAHKGALAVGAKTCAVLAGGVDNTYPSVHAGLFMQIRESGCLVSQFAYGSKPVAFKFLQRNALIAALSHAVLVVEAPPKSGALTTATAAADLGREVFVVPANIDQPGFRGSHNLVRDGATLVFHPDQLLESLGIEPVKAAKETHLPSGVGERILAVLTVNPTAPEVIVEKTGLDTSEVLSELTMLELEGRILHDTGGYARKP